MKYNYVIFHRNCLDGFSSFIILTKTHTILDDAEIYPDMPSSKTIPPSIENKDVIIMDVAYSYDVLKEIVLLAKSVTFIDHHITIHDDVTKLVNDNNTNLKVVYDEKESGASLTWKYFFKNKKMPLFVRYIKDNDIGAWVLKNTYYFIAGLTVGYPTDLRAATVRQWNNLFDIHEVKRLIRKGRVYWEQLRYQLEGNVKKYSMELFPSEKICREFPDDFEQPGQFRVAVYNSMCPDGSLLGKEAMKKINCDFALMWVFHMDEKKFVMSLRSTDVDVGRIAKVFGGGDMCVLPR